MVNPEKIAPNSHEVNILKLRDVGKLLTKNVGSEWPQINRFHYYRQLLIHSDAEQEVNDTPADLDQELESDEVCEYLAETPDSQFSY